MMAVVKADAYGHGAVRVARVAEDVGASLGVLTVAEALELRRAGIRAPILVMAPPLPTEARAAAEVGAELTVDSKELLDHLGHSAHRPVAIHVDVDFGLKRWGVKPDDLFDLVDQVKRHKKLVLTGLSTHIDYVPGKNAIEAETKLKQFQRLASQLKRDYPKLRCHAANSSILMDFPKWQLDMARVGNLIYGINRSSREAALKNPWKFYARIVSISEAARGAAIGYASEFIAPRKMKVASVAAGYADGLTMEPAERFIGLGGGFRYWGVLKGKETPFIGRCSISHVLLDVTGVPRVKVGDPILMPVRRTAASARIPRVFL